MYKKNREMFLQMKTLILHFISGTHSVEKVVFFRIFWLQFTFEIMVKKK